MKKGRELDALVAEKVMGWTGVRPYFTGGPFGVDSFEGKRGEFDEELFWKEHPGSKEAGGGINKEAYVEVLRYSTDIQAAWQVVEKMCSRGLFVSLETIVGMDAKRKFRCQFREAMGSGEWGESESAAEAICLGALEAKRGRLG